MTLRSVSSVGSLSRTVSGSKSDGQLRSVVRIELVAEWNSQCLSYSDSQFYKLLLINKCVLIKPVFHYIMDLGPSDQRQTAQGLNMATQEIGVETVRDTVRSDTVNTFKSKLDKFWQQQPIIYDFTAEILGTGSRSWY